jgi:hypothetical protein
MNTSALCFTSSNTFMNASGSRDGVVRIGLGYGLDDPGMECRHVQNVQIGSGNHQPPIQCVPGIKRPGHEADHSPPCSAEVKNEWRYTSTPPIVLYMPNCTSFMMSVRYLRYYFEPKNEVRDDKRILNLKRSKWSICFVVYLIMSQCVPRMDMKITRSICCYVIE